jgi:hypothetical protein
MNFVMRLLANAIGRIFYVCPVIAGRDTTTAVRDL